MRKISFGDIHRLIIQSLNYRDNNGANEKSYKSMNSGLVLSINNNSRNELMKELYGKLQYRSNKMIRRVFERYSTGQVYNQNDEIVVNEFSLLDIWEEFSDIHLTEKDTYYIRINKFEEWKRNFHTLDEDLIILNAFVRNKIEGENLRFDQIVNFISQMKTFATPYEPQVKSELKKGVAQQHLHLSGAYPAPYYWTAVMNNRVSVESILYNEQASEDLRYFSIEDTKTLISDIEFCKVIRVFFYDIIEDLMKNMEISKSHMVNASELLTLYENNVKEELEQTLCDNNKKIEKLKSRYNDYFHTLLVRYMGQRSKVICKSLLGERLMLTYLLKYVNECAVSEENKLISQILWIYIQTKNSFLSRIQQQEGIAGFDFFQYTLQMISWKEKKSETTNFAIEIGEFLQESSYILKQEFMIAPQYSSSQYDDILNIISIIKNTMTDNLDISLKETYKEVKVGVIVHFIKDEGDFLRQRLVSDETAYKIYHFSQRDRNKRLLDVLINYKQEENTVESTESIPIVSLDTANKELFTPPEIYGEIYKEAYKLNFN